jgi:nitrite reductase (cytochrome c-552)
LLARAERIQSTTYELRNTAMDALIELIGQIKAARAAGVDEAGLAAALDWQRQAQFLLDFIEAENSMGFHAPQEAARILFQSLERIRKGQEALRRLGMPAIGSAQAPPVPAGPAIPASAAQAPSVPAGPAG